MTHTPFETESCVAQASLKLTVVLRMRMTQITLQVSMPVSGSDTIALGKYP